MSSVGQVVGGIVGGVIGFFVGGPTGALYGAQLGMMAGGLIDPPDGPVINGPRLDDLTVQTSTYGAFIPRNYGTVAQHGNIFWLKGDKLTETPRVEESGGKGGPTTTTNTWDYSATFALGLCEGPIDGIRRIWINNQLWYDAGSSDISSIIANNATSSAFTLYKGTDTQLADPLMQADKGAANVPAYRGLAYIVFDNLQLAKYNNSLAGTQIKVEILKNATIAAPRLVTVAQITGWPHPVTAPKIMSVSDGVITAYAYNAATATAVLSDGEYYPDNEHYINISHSAVTLDTSPVAVDLLRPNTYSTGNQSIPLGLLDRDVVWWPEYGHTLTIGGTKQVLPYGSLGATRGTASATGVNGDITSYLAGETGRYVIGVAVNEPGNRILITTGSVSRNSSGIADRYFLLDESLNTLKSGTISNTTKLLWNIGQNSQLQPAGGTVLSDDGLTGWTVDSSAASAIDVYYFYFDSANVLTLNAPIATTVNGDNRIGTYLSGNVFFIINTNTAFGTIAELITYTSFPTLTGGTTVLGDIIRAECLQSSLLASSDMDVTELTDTVRGYRISSLGALRGGIDPLRAAWPFDVVQNGYKIKFKRRGSASVVTINADELDARVAGENPGVQITNSREMDTLLPSKLLLKYIDATREYDTNEQPSDRDL